MAVFIILNETDANGSFLRKTVVNAELIVRIDQVEIGTCCVRLQSFPSESFFTTNNLEDIQRTLNGACS